MKIKSIKKSILYSFLIVLGTFCFAIKVDAMDNAYGIFCAYGDYYFMYSVSSREETANIDTNFDELGTAIESGRPGLAFDKETETDWLKSKGIINSDGDFACPTNPFGTTLGTSTNKECGTIGCHVVDVATSYESYSCSYISQERIATLNIKYVSDANNRNGKWTVTYPDKSTATFVGTEVNGNFMPGKDCNDIYFTEKDKRISVAVYANEEVTNNATLNALCKSYGDNEIEHFCSGNCKQKALTCTSAGKCPRELRPIIIFVKKVAFNTVQLFVPILLILMGTIDFVKAVASSDDKGNKEAISKFIKRIFAAILVFFVVTIVTIVMNMFAKTDLGEQNDWQSCWNDID